MGKRIIQRARGHGGPAYRTRKQAYRISVSYPRTEGIGEVLKLMHLPCYDAPVAKIKLNREIFYNIAAEGMYEGQKIMVGKNATLTVGNIVPLARLPIGTLIYNIETIPGMGGKMVRTSGIAGRVTKKEPQGISVLLPSKQEKRFNPNARASIGTVAASGRLEKPLVKASKSLFIAKATGGRVYPRTSAVKMNVIDHPFGSGRGKRIKSKIAKKWAPPGRKVGLLRPRRTGRGK